jgi:hypothetical protein
VECIENWRLIIQAGRALTAAGQAPFTRIAVYKWIWSRYPRREHDRPSLDPTLQGMVSNAWGSGRRVRNTALPDRSRILRARRVADRCGLVHRDV